MNRVSAESVCSSSRDHPSDRAHALVFRLSSTGLFREYHQVFEIITAQPLALRALGSFQAPLDGSRRRNLFCSLMAQHSHSCAACLQFQQRVEDALGHQPKTLECHAGLVESAVPVWVGDTLIGYLQTGQVFLQAPVKARFAQVVRDLRRSGVPFELAELEKAYFQTRVVAAKKYDSILQLLMVFAQQLDAVGQEIMPAHFGEELPAITKARTFIADHLNEEIRLHDVARAAGMSPFYFCKLFRRSTGLTYTRYLARLRVEVAKQALLKPKTRITDAAYTAGFQSLSQFNRVFLRVAGETPTHFRAHCPGSVNPHCDSEPRSTHPQEGGLHTGHPG